MPERLVDVVKHGLNLLHTFPVKVPDAAAEEAAFHEKAKDAATFAQVVPPHELDTLSTRLHVDRGGPLLPYGDRFGVLAETKEGLEQFDRERAYALWEQAGRPEGQADAFWHAAQQQRFRDRAYLLWEREGHPEGRADEHWHRTRGYESE